MTDTATEAPCAICGGTKAEHEGRQHAYTLNPGQLATPEQLKKTETPQTPFVMRAPSMGNPQMDRLIDLLLHKGIIDPGEALYVAIGRPIQ